jgi:hypothetical protein
MTSVSDPAASRAVLIGTSRHTTSLTDLPAVTANVHALSELFRSPVVWGLPKEHCVTVLDPVTRRDMIAPIREAADTATDTLLVYYAGHGLQSYKGDLHLALTGSNSVEVSYTAVAYDVVREQLIDTRAERKIVVLDCCYGALAIGSLSNGDPVSALADDAAVEGTYLIAAAAENKKALWVSGERYTAFTAELVTVLNDGLRGSGPYLDLDTIYQEVRVALRAKQRPIPQNRVRNSAGAIVIARNKAYRPAPAADPPETAIPDPVIEHFQSEQVKAETDGSRRKRRNRRAWLAAVVACLVVGGSLLTASLLPPEPPQTEGGRPPSSTAPGSSPSTVSGVSVSGGRASVASAFCSVEDVTVSGSLSEEPRVTIPKSCQPPASLLTLDLAPGSGPAVRKGANIEVRYTMVSWSNGVSVDNSFAKGMTFPIENFGNGALIAGWEEGLIGLKQGGRRLLVIPPDKAYGDKGQPSVKPGETMVCVVDAVKVSQGAGP